MSPISPFLHRRPSRPFCCRSRLYGETQLSPIISHQTIIDITKSSPITSIPSPISSILLPISSIPSLISPFRHRYLHSIADISIPSPISPFCHRQSHRPFRRRSRHRSHPTTLPLRLSFTSNRRSFAFPLLCKFVPCSSYIFVCLIFIFLTYFRYPLVIIFNILLPLFVCMIFFSRFASVDYFSPFFILIYLYFFVCLFSHFYFSLFIFFSIVL